MPNNSSQFPGQTQSQKVYGAEAYEYYKGVRDIRTRQIETIHNELGENKRCRIQRKIEEEKID